MTNYFSLCQPDDRVPRFLECGVFAPVSSGILGDAMPVIPVALNNQVGRRNVEVAGVSADWILANEFNPHEFQAIGDRDLDRRWRGKPFDVSVSAILSAANAALCFARSKAFTANLAANVFVAKLFLVRPKAFSVAVTTLANIKKVLGSQFPLTAKLAFSFNKIGFAFTHACHAAKLRIGRSGLKGTTAVSAGNLAYKRPAGIAAFPRTILSLVFAPFRYLKAFAAVPTVNFDLFIKRLFSFVNTGIATKLCSCIYCGKKIAALNARKPLRLPLFSAVGSAFRGAKTSVFCNACKNLATQSAAFVKRLSHTFQLKYSALNRWGASAETCCSSGDQPGIALFYSTA